MVGAPVQASLARAEWQSVVFAERPRRADLLELAASDLPATPVRIHVHRNQPFESIASCAKAFLRYGGWDPTFTYGPYDDSLSFCNRVEADVEFLWLDLARYQRPREELAGWLRERVRYLRELTDRPILVASGDPAMVPLLPRVRVCADGFMELGEAACVETARQFAFLWLPPVLRPRFETLVVDLNHTTRGSSKVQRALARLQESSVRMVEFRGVCDAWRRLRGESTLFVGDDASALAELAFEIPEPSLFHAADLGETVRALSLYPGLSGYDTPNSAPAGLWPPYGA